jgi:hypothetical protein
LDFWLQLIRNPRAQDAISGVTFRERTFPMTQQMLANNGAVIGRSLKEMSDEWLTEAESAVWKQIQSLFERCPRADQESSRTQSSKVYWRKDHDR